MCLQVSQFVELEDQMMTVAKVTIEAANAQMTTDREGDSSETELRVTVS